MALLVKICGLKTPDALDAALDAGADMVGFVFFPPSPRNLGIEAARALGERVQGRAKKVALSVDATDAELDRVVEALKPDMLQLHGKETPERVVAVRSRFRLPVMKALPIETRADLAPIRLYEKVADWLLFDARAPREATRPGGLGKTFDWTLLENLDLEDAVHAVGRARCRQRRRGVADHAARRRSMCRRASSARPGEKDPDKIRAFIRAARRRPMQRVVEMPAKARARRAPSPM